MQELLHGASIAFVLKVLAAVLGLALNVVITRGLGADSAGLYFLAFMIVSIAVTLGQFGTSGTVIRFVSAAVSEGNWGKVKGVYKNSLMISFVCSLFFSVSLFLLAPVISNIFNKPGLETILQFMSFAILPIAIYSLHASALQGLKKIRDANIVLGVSAPFFAIMGCLLLIPNYNIIGATIAYVISALITLLIGVALWKSHLSEYENISSNFEFNQIIKSAIPLFSVAIFNLVLTLSAPLFLGAWGTESELAVFHIANRIAMLTSFIIIAANSIFAPNLSACFAQNDLELASHLIKKVTGLMLVLATPILLLIIVFSQEIMMFFGDEFKNGSNLLIILAIAQFVNVATGSVGQILIMSGNELKLQHAFLLTAIIVFIASYFLVHTLGAIGAAYSVAIGVIIVKILSSYFVFKHVKISLFNFGRTT